MMNKPISINYIVCINLQLDVYNLNALFYLKPYCSVCPASNL